MACSVLIISGCYRKGENIPVNPPTVTTHLADAWSEFETGSYEAAVTSFTAAKDRDAGQAEAYLGLGWALARVLSYEQAESNFRIMQSITDDQSMILDSYAGLAVCFAAMKQNDEAIAEAQKVLELSPAYQFSHDSYVNALAMHKVVARSYVDQMDYLSALDVVDSSIEPGFITGLLGEGMLLHETKDSSPITSANTNVKGEVTLRLTKTKSGAEVPIELVKVISVKNQDGVVSYDILSFQQGVGDIVVKGNPIPKSTDILKVELIYASDYGLFLSKLFEKIASLRSGI